MCVCWQNLLTHAATFQEKANYCTAPGLTLTLLHAIHPKYDIIVCSHWCCYLVSTLWDQTSQSTKSRTFSPGPVYQVTRRGLHPGPRDQNKQLSRSSVMCKRRLSVGPPSLSPLWTVAGPDKTLLQVNAPILAAGRQMGASSWMEHKPHSDKGTAVMLGRTHQFKELKSICALLHESELKLCRGDVNDFSQT